MLKRLRRNRLARLARKHKALCRKRRIFFCVECKSKLDQQSDHILSQHYYPKLRYKLWNLCIRCEDCNQRKSDKFYWELRSFRVMARASIQSSLIPSALALFLLIALHYLAVYAYFPIDVLSFLSAFLPPEILCL